MLLKQQQSRKELLLARAEQEAGPEKPGATPHSNLVEVRNPQNRPTLPENSKSHALQDYQMQLMLLERHNRIRLALANAEREKLKLDRKQILDGLIAAQKSSL